VRNIETPKESSLPEAKRGIPRLIAAAGYSFAGLKAVFRSEEAFRLEVYTSVVLIPLGLWLGEGGVEKLLLAGSLVLLMIIEMFNTAVEVVIDRIGPEFHAMSKVAKDVGSACVFLGIGLVLATWLLILGF
jgi:diacylglycerol kinase (ATP)